MEDITVISYTGSKGGNLLSLDENGYRYMIPFAGRFRVIDFTIRNSLLANPRDIIIYGGGSGELDEYIKNYKNSISPLIKTSSGEYSDIMFFYSRLMDSNSNIYIIYNGDDPSIINFQEVIKKFKGNKSKALLFRLKTGIKSTIDGALLIISQDALLKIVNKFIDEKTKTRNIFELLNTTLAGRKTKIETIEAWYRPMKNINQYYSANMELLKKNGIFTMIHNESDIQTFIRSNEYAFISSNARVSGSFLSDSCKISGEVRGSVIFPCVEIGENTTVKNSIILPHVKIGRDCKIVNSIIDETTDRDNGDGYLNIGNKCKIGSEYKDIKNKDMPRLLNKSITLVGKNCRVPDESGVGGACYIAPGKGLEYWQRNKYLYNGESIK